MATALIRRSMFTPIHRALGIEPGDLSLNLIEQAVENRVEETTGLDWKKSIYDTRRPAWEDEAAKDIAAMANSGGGWVVFGVAEDSETNTASEIAPIQWNADVQQRILRVAYSRIGPPVLGLEFFPFPSDNGSVVMMRVPDSRDAPHFARKGGDAFVAPRRNGSHTVFMSDREIERGFRERFQHADNREQHIQDLFEQVSQSLDPDDGVCLVMVAVPVEPATSVAPMSEADVHKLVSQELIPELVCPHSSPMRWDFGVVRKGLRQWVIRSSTDDSHPYRQYLHDDATMLSCYRLGNFTDREEASPYCPTGLPNHCMSSHIESALIGFVTLLRAHAANRQSNAGFRIRVGLVGKPGEPIFIRTTESRSNYLLAVDYAEPIHRFQPVSTELDPLSPVADILPVMNDLARDVINQGGVKFLKVMAEPNDSSSS